MTREELYKLITERNEDVTKNDIPKVINPIMDIYQKGFTTGMDVGRELVIDKVYVWLENYAELTGIDSEVIKESFRKAMEE